MATRVPVDGQTHFVDMHFPAAGIDVSAAFDKQPARQIAEGDYARTSAFSMNVRGFEPQAGRRRGGSRPGLRKYIPQAVLANWIVQELATIVTTASGPMQQNNVGRVVSLVTVSQGNVSYARAGDTTWTAAVNNTPNSPPLNFSGIMFAAANQQKLWFADGTNWVYFDPTPGSVNLWVPAAVDLQGNPLPTNLLPVDSRGNTPRLIDTWRGRTILSGLLFDPQNWFMSAVGDPRNFCYSPTSVTGTQAVAGNNSSLGLIGDVVTALIPYNDDVLVFGGDHTIYTMTGDPMAGGQIDLVSDAIGIAWGRAWCKDPYGNIYFVSNRTGIYTMVPGQQPQRISQAIEQLLTPIDTGNNAIRLIWNDRFQGLHVFVTPLTAPGATGTVTHFFYEQRSGAWWMDQFGNPNLDPLCCVTFDGNQPGDRVPLIGSWDGYVRAIDPVATTDDGTPISWSVLIGPIVGNSPETLLAEILLKDIQVVLGETSSNVSYNVLVGRSAEAALASAPVASGTLLPGRNFVSGIRRDGHAVYVQLFGSNPFEMEVIKAKIATRGKVLGRGR